ncbi:hypothetical protein E2C01_067758 [Portunus trituberculatus]|uniref:Uncharacterized protein n=1 Tax=Portunus trituberculatus TaxID=210409 RepID=A0A5B7HUJ1_PORTR|nr:hypothetical protein [Portunus trituberculatus]
MDNEGIIRRESSFSFSQDVVSGYTKLSSDSCLDSFFVVEIQEGSVAYTHAFIETDTPAEYVGQMRHVRTSIGPILCEECKRRSE